MALVDYIIEDNVAILSMNAQENRFNLPFFEGMFETLDRIEKDTAANVLVTKSSDEKIWCNGIDLDWLIPVQQGGDYKLVNQFYTQMYSLFKRLLTYPMITVAAITGHAFAGGAFLAFSHDFRFMRNDRGWLCLPEIDLKMTLGPALIGIARRVLSEPDFEEMEYTGVRLTARECERRHIIRKACNLESLMPEVLAFSKKQNKDREIVRQMKHQTHEQLLSIIDKTLSSLNE